MAGKPAAPPVGHDSRTCVCVACCAYRLEGRGKGGLGKLFGRKPKPKEYRRTCQQCGAVRYLSVADATAKEPSTAGAKLDYLGSSLQNLGSADARSTLRLSRLEGQRDRVRQDARCPNCGSSRYTQTPEF